MGLFGRYLEASAMDVNLDTSFVLTVPGINQTNIRDDLLIENDYRVRFLTSGDPEHSWHYNPFDYIYGEDGEISKENVDIMVGAIKAALYSTSRFVDPFRTGHIMSLITACIWYLLEFNSSPDAHCMFYLSRLVKKAAFEDKRYGTELSRLFETARERNPKAECFRYYDTYMLFIGKDRKEAVFVAIDALCEFEIPEISRITTTSAKNRITATPAISYTASDPEDFDGTNGNIEILRAGDRKTAVLVSNPGKPDGMLLPLFKWHMYHLLEKKAKDVCRKKWMIARMDGQSIVTMIDSEDTAKRILCDIRHIAKDGEYLGERFKTAYVKRGNAGLPYPVICELGTVSMVIGGMED